ncbi:HAD family hydrolase [Cyanobium sp. ULC084]|nr:MAG: HAD family hydrolase [Cyanobium sp.]
MTFIRKSYSLTLSILFAVVFLIVFITLARAIALPQPSDPLPSWNQGEAKQTIIKFVQSTTTQGNPEFVPPAERIAEFDLDGTLWVEHPLYTQVMFALERVPDLIKAKPELAQVEPFKTVLSGNKAGLAKLTDKDWFEIVLAAQSGMTTEAFTRDVNAWLAKARHPRWSRPYTELTYQPMQEVLKYFRANGFKTFIATGGSQGFVRPYSERVYDIPPEQVAGTAQPLRYGYGNDGLPTLTRQPKLLLNNLEAGKIENFYLLYGRRPLAAFGNSSSDDRQILEYTTAGPGRRLGMLVLHDDAKREYAYGPAQGLPDTTVGTFNQELYEEAKKKGWIVISMKNDWKQIFSFEPRLPSHR